MRNRRNSSSGVTLIELAVVIALVGVLAMIAVPNLGKMLPQYRLNRTVRELSDHVQTARLLAVSQNRQYRICMITKDAAPTTGDLRSNKGRYLIQAGDLSSNSSVWDTLPIGTGSAEGDIAYDFTSSKGYYSGVSISGWTTLGGSGTGNTDCIVFSPRGWIENPSDDFSNAGYIHIYFRNKAANPTNDSRTVLISRGGMTRIRVGDSTTVNTAP